MRWIRKLRLRFESLFRRSRVESDLDDELRDYLDREIERAMAAGSSREEANRHALSSLHGVERVKEECRDARGVGLLDDLRQDVRYALRLTTKNVGFSVVAVATLGLGIGANTAVFSLVSAALLRPLPIPFGERVAVVEVESALAGNSGGRVSPAQFRSWRQNQTAFELLAASSGRRSQIVGLGVSDEIRSLSVSEDFLDVAGAAVERGRQFQPEDFANPAPRVCLVSARYWQSKLNGDPNIVGSTLELDGEPVTVVGVLSSRFAFPDAETDVWTTLRVDPPRESQHFLEVYGRVGIDASVESARSALTAVTVRDENGWPDWRKTQSITATLLRERIVSDQKKLLIVLTGIAVLVLLVCCANLSAMLLARHRQRAREIALRASIGATHSRLIRQLVTESCLLNLAGVVVGLAVARAFLHLGQQLLNDSRFATLIAGREEIVDWRMAAFAVAVVVLTTVLSGLLPAMHLTGFDLYRTLKSGSEKAGPMGPRWLGGPVVAAELAAAFVLVCGAGLLFRSFIGLMEVDRGYSVDHLLTARLPLPTGTPPSIQGRKQFFRRLEQQLSGLPGVAAIGIVTGLPLGGLQASMTIKKPGEPFDPQSLPWVAINSVNAGYFPAMRIGVVKGRVFGPGDNETSLRVAIVNETLARQFWPDQDAMGQELMPGVQIVGIVNDVRQEALQTDQGPAFYLPFEQRANLAAAPNFVLVRTTGDPEELADALRASVQSLNPLQPVMDVRTMEQVLSQSVNQRLLLTTLMCGFALLAIIIAAAGVYGVLSHVVSGQTREIGIRLCLGATRTDVIWLIGSQLAIAASVGLVCGVVATWLGAHVLSSWLFSVAADDLTTFGAATLITLVAALAGATVPLGRALRVDPATAVRAE